MPVTSITKFAGGHYRASGDHEADLPAGDRIGWVFTARFMDRVGKGIRGAPRDALVADIAPPALRGAAYGLRESLDSVGAFIGPLLAVALMVLFANDISNVYQTFQPIPSCHSEGYTLPAPAADFRLATGD